MKDLEIYFTPIEKPDGFAENAIGNSIDVHTEASFPVMETGGLAIMYIPEYRNGEVQYQGKTDDTFRNYFYQSFASIGWKATIYDLGQLLPGETIDDTYFAISNVCAELVKNEIIPIIIGGSQDLTYGMYKGYEQLEQLVNICAVDSKLDIGRPEDNFTAKSYMSHLLIQRPCYLFNFSNIGCQGLFASKEEFELFEKLYFDVCRLGEFNADFKRAEPHLRNTDILSIDLES